MNGLELDVFKGGANEDNIQISLNAIEKLKRRRKTILEMDRVMIGTIV